VAHQLLFAQSFDKDKRTMKGMIGRMRLFGWLAHLDLSGSRQSSQAGAT